MMTTRKKSRQGFGAMYPEYRRRDARHGGPASHGRYENDYNSNFENTLGEYDDEEDNHFATNSKMRNDRYINDDEDYNGRSYARSGRRYEDEYDDVQDEYYGSQSPQRHRRHDDEDRDDYNRSFEQHHYSRRGFGSMGRHNYENERGGREYAYGSFSRGESSSYSDGNRERDYDEERRGNRGYGYREDQHNRNTGMGRQRFVDERSNYGYGRNSGLGQSSERRYNTPASKLISSQKRSPATSTNKHSGNKR